MLRLLAGAAVIAMAAMPLHAQPGKSGDNGNKGGAVNAAKPEGKNSAKRGGPPSSRGQEEPGNADRGADRSGASPSDRGNGNQARTEQSQANRGNGAQVQGNRGNAGPSTLRGPGNARGNGNPDARAKGNAGGPPNAIRPGGGPDRVVSRRGNERRSGYAGALLREALNSHRGLIAGCPPGLAKKRNGCLPPGQARQAYRSYRPSLFGYSGLGDGRYYLNDGYLLRYSDNGLAGFIPLLAGALSIGNTWPNSYDASPLPDYYVDYYRLGPSSNYRYADDVIYRVDPETTAISSVAAILTGDDFVVGQPMPAGYDVYNVPYAYRDRYYDTPDARYRYADGYVYRVDPETALITAAIDLLT